ncbi:hypothetical protein, partial [Phocaeicola vulgatus]|uniref:hypothetical protein n=1 Tax=Phocaeicola vulgatus TaxID=821 RepID=UPI001C707B10
MLCILLLILAISFALVIFANVKLFHSETLTGMIAIFSVLVTVTLVVVSLIFWKSHSTLPLLATQ